MTKPAQVQVSINNCSKKSDKKIKNNIKRFWEGSQLILFDQSPGKILPYSKKWLKVNSERNTMTPCISQYIREGEMCSVSKMAPKAFLREHHANLEHRLEDSYHKEGTQVHMQ